MPKKVKVDETFFARQNAIRASVLECLRDLDAWEFRVGADFKGKPQNFAGRIRVWSIENDLKVRVKVDNEKGIVTAQAFEMSEEDWAVRNKSRARAMRAQAARRLKEQAEQREQTTEALA